MFLIITLTTLVTGIGFGLTIDRHYLLEDQISMGVNFAFSFLSLIIMIGVEVWNERK
jgi:hypothetical protein